MGLRWHDLNVTDDKDQFIAGLVAQHGVVLEKYLASKLGSPEDAAELAQEAYMRLHRLEQPETLDNARAFITLSDSEMSSGMR